MIRTVHILLLNFTCATTASGMESTAIITTSQKKNSNTTRPLKKSFTHNASTKNNIKENPLLKAIKEKDSHTVINILNLDINQADSEGNTPLILAAKDGNEIIVDILLSKKKLKPNITNLVGMTALHHAALNRHYIVLEKLMRDPRIDVSIMNKYRNTARELIDQSTKTIDLRRNIFGRATLDIETNRQVIEIQLSSNKITVPILNKEVQEIKSRIFNTHAHQDNDGRALPEQACLPDYATNEFIAQMILLRAPKNLIKKNSFIL